MGALSPVHLIIILVIALLVLGPGKLPETGAALGRAVRGFRDAVEGKEDESATPMAPTETTADLTAGSAATISSAPTDDEAGRPTT